MSSFSVVVATAARAEFDEALRHIAESGSIEAALRWFEGLESLLLSLEQSPERFAVARED